MEVKVNREIREYTEGVFFGMSLRQCVFALLACVAAVGLYFGLSPFLRLDELSWACIAGAAPFAALGFVTWHGMAVERAAGVGKYALLTQELPARPQNVLRGRLLPHRAKGIRREGGHMKHFQPGGAKAARGSSAENRRGRRARRIWRRRVPHRRRRVREDLARERRELRGGVKD
ncbi:MAG: PrgI family protein [Eggerthellaceae bacterium]